MTLSAQPCGTEKDFDCSIQTQPLDKPCGGEPAIEVGAILQAEQELDDTICELGLKSEAAMAAGDRDGAGEYMNRMYVAIRSRTPEHQARLHAEVERRVRDELTFHGEWTAAVVEQKGSAGA